jgi:HEAT repeats/Carboxypeptidase regulatory-like domain
MWKSSCALCAIVFALQVAGPPVEQGTGGGDLTIHGLVTLSGYGVPRVEVLARRSGVKSFRATLTDETGRYSLSRLSPGQYTVNTYIPKFQSDAQEIDLPINASSTLDFMLKLRPDDDCTPDCLTSEFPSVELPDGTIREGRVERRERADRTVGQMWELSMLHMGAVPGNGKLPPVELRKQSILSDLNQLGADTVPPLQFALQDPDVQMRRNAALVLSELARGLFTEGPAKLDLRETLASLIAALEDSDDDVRSWSAQAIGRIGPEASPAVPALIDLLKGPGEASRNGACIALGDIGSAARDALPALYQALQDPSKDVRKFAQQAIDKIQNQEAKALNPRPFTHLLRLGVGFWLLPGDGSQ